MNESLIVLATTTITPQDSSQHTSGVNSGDGDSIGWGSIILVFAMTIVSIITILGNLVVLLSYYLDKTIRQPSNYFIFSLAVSDLIIGVEGIPMYTYFFINDLSWPFGAFTCDLWLSIDYSCCLASIYTVLGITIDRYCSVKCPADYRNWRTQTKVMLIIAATWIIPSVLFSVSIFGYGFFSGRGRILKEDECYVQFMTNAYLNMGMYIAYYWSTLCLMLYLYYGIYSAAKKLSHRSNEKQKRLALLSEMRQRPSKRDKSTFGASEPSYIDSDSFTKNQQMSNPINNSNAADSIRMTTMTNEKSVMIIDRSETTFIPSGALNCDSMIIFGAFRVEEEFPFIDDIHSSDPSLCANDSIHHCLQDVGLLRIHASADLRRSIDRNGVSHKTATISNDSRTDRPQVPHDDDSLPGTMTATTALVDIVVEKGANGTIAGVRRLLTVMRYTSRKTRKARKSTKTHSRSENRARKALRTITIILGTFIAFWTPFYILATIYGFCERCSTSDNFNTLYTISYYLCYMNSPINPLCYAMANAQFKRTFKRILRGDLRRT